jgi:carbon storage regulator
MLVLTRKIGEEIIIDNHIRVTVVAVNGEKVRIGITAPKDVVVDRQEIHAKRTRWEPSTPVASVIGKEQA